MADRGPLLARVRCAGRGLVGDPTDPENLIGTSRRINSRSAPSAPLLLEAGVNLRSRDGSHAPQSRMVTYADVGVVLMDDKPER